MGGFATAVNIVALVVAGLLAGAVRADPSNNSDDHGEEAALSARGWLHEREPLPLRAGVYDGCRPLHTHQPTGNEQNQWQCA